MNCPYCNSTVSFVNSMRIYGKDFGMVYLCDNYPSCDAYVGVHKGTHQPLGRLANSELREWKKKAHKVFDPLWQSKLFTRNGAYRLIQDLMNLPADKAHIGMFDVEQCKELIEKLEEYEGYYQRLYEAEW